MNNLAGSTLVLWVILGFKKMEHLWFLTNAGLQK